MHCALFDEAAVYAAGHAAKALRAVFIELMQCQSRSDLLVICSAHELQQLCHQGSRNHLILRKPGQYH